MSTSRNSTQPAAESTSSVSRGLPTVVADLFLDDICPDDIPFGTVDALQTTRLLRASPTTGARNARRRTDVISQGTHDEGIRNTRICGLRDGGRYGAVRHRYHSSRSLHSSPTSSAEGDDETKRRKNREAAARCRQRKSERVVRLEEKAKQLMEDNDGLELEAAVLQNQITEFRSSLLKHMQSGCPIRWVN